MKWSDTVKRTAERAGCTEEQARTILQAFTDTAIEAVCEGEDVRIPGLLAVGRTWREPSRLRSIADGRRIALDGRYTPRLRSSTRLRRALRELSPQPLKDPAHQEAWRLAEALVGDIELYHRARLPVGLAGHASPDEVDARCHESLGQVWSSARDTWSARTPAEVRDRRDHLALAARQRWQGLGTR